MIPAVKGILASRELRFQLYPEEAAGESMSSPMSTGSSLLALLAALALGAAPAAASGDSVLLATTTSVRDSGLLDALLPIFSERTGIRVRVVAVGSGAALRLGAGEARRVVQGGEIHLSGSPPMEPGARLAAVGPGGELIAILEAKPGRRLRPLRVLRSLAPDG